MARSTQHEWFSFRRAFSRRASQQRSTKRQPLRRRLRFEPLEDRRLLALVTVTTLGDTVDFGDGVTSLREAIFATNLVGGADTIEFAASLTSAGAATLTLTQGELPIADALAINGPGADLLTIDASGNDPTPDSTFDDDDFTNDGDGSRVFNIDDGNLDTQIDVSISGLTLAGGDVTGDGGAIRSHENLTVADSTISGNSAGINFTYWYKGRGGGIFSYYGNLTVTGSTISGNSTDGGGGIWSGNVTVTGSTISGNSAYGTVHGYGGGVLGVSVTVTGSTIEGNTAGRDGGGIWGGNVTVTDSTISGNSAVLNGGGIHAITTASISHTIVAGNHHAVFTGDDIFGSIAAASAYNLISVDTGLTGISNGTNGNQIGTAAAPINPLLGPLANNGGPTKTHALLASSPAIDAGDPSIVFNPAEHDQRGAPFGRVFEGDGDDVARIDIGAYESQPDGTLGDYNRDGGVNAADYVMWRKFLSSSVAPPFTGADGDGDSAVDPGDYDVWEENFGETLPGVGSGAAPELIAPRIQFVEHAEAAATDSNLPHVETDAAAARTSSFAAFSTRSHRPNSTSKTARRPINQHRLAESRADDLLLLAIDCIGRSPQQAFVVHDHEENDEHHADDDINSQIDESLAVALAEWQ